MDVSNHFDEVTHHRRPGRRRGGGWRGADVPRPDRTGDGRVPYPGRAQLLRRGPASHFSFGLGFFFNAWASTVAAGAFTQDVDHRILPNWGAAALMIKNRDLATTLHDPKKMAIACGIIGAIVVAFLNSTAAAVPAAL